MRGNEEKGGGGERESFPAVHHRLIRVLSVPDAHHPQQRYRDGIQDLKDAEENTAGLRERCDNVTGCSRRGSPSASVPPHNGHTMKRHIPPLPNQTRKQEYGHAIYFIYLFSSQNEHGPSQNRREDKCKKKKRASNYKNESTRLNIVQLIVL